MAANRSDLQPLVVWSYVDERQVPNRRLQSDATLTNSVSRKRPFSNTPRMTVHGRELPFSASSFRDSHATQGCTCTYQGRFGVLPSIPCRNLPGTDATNGPRCCNRWRLDEESAVADCHAFPITGTSGRPWRFHQDVSLCTEKSFSDTKRNNSGRAAWRQKCSAFSPIKHLITGCFCEKNNGDPISGGFDNR